MNCANIVYSPPEIEGESINPGFKRKLNGLGLTNINILPHYDVFKNYVLDNKKYIEDIILPDSYKFDIIAIPDGTYLLVEDNETLLYGEAYLIKNGKLDKISNDNQVIKVCDK